MRILGYFLVITPLLLISVLLWHYFGFDYNKRYSDIDNIVSLTKLNTLSYKVTWYEPRIRRFESNIYTPYPELPSAEKLNYIYGDMYAK